MLQCKIGSRWHRFALCTVLWRSCRCIGLLEFARARAIGSELSRCDFKDQMIRKRVPSLRF